MNAARKCAPRRFPTLAVTCQLPYRVGLELQAKADELGITRHRLFLSAFEAGFPIVLEQDNAHKAGDTAVQQQQQG